MNIFSPNDQNKSLTARTITALDKLSDGLKHLYIKGQKATGLTPLQIKIMLYIAGHEPELNTVSNLVRELMVTKATISDSIKALEKKRMITKKLDTKDNRSFSIWLSPKGEKSIEELQNLMQPFEKALHNLSTESSERLYVELYSILKTLDSSKTINIQRDCLSCKNYRSDGINHAFCMKLRTQIKAHEKRMDCPVYEKQLVKSIN